MVIFFASDEVGRRRPAGGDLSLNEGFLGPARGLLLVVLRCGGCCWKNCC